MTFIEKLLRAEVTSLVALLVCVVFIGFYGFLESFVWSLQGKKLLIEPLDAGWILFKVSGAVGLAGVLFYGAPAYAVLSYKRVAFWWTAILVGAAPGIAFLPFEQNLGGWLMVCGVAVSAITHFLNVRFASRETAL